LNGVEDTPVEAGDLIYVGPGVYRESLTVDVDGSSGSPITYIGDYTGANTDGTGGVVRITGSDNDITLDRASCITASSKNYRTFTGFTIENTSNYGISLTTCTNIVVDECFFHCLVNNINCAGASQSGLTVSNSIFAYGTNAIVFTHTAEITSAGHSVSNCIIYSQKGVGITSDDIAGITVKNTLFTGCQYAFRITDGFVTAALMITVNNCIVANNLQGFNAKAAGEIVEDYNSVYNNATDRTNTDTGAHSNAYAPLTDSRWFFEMVNGGTLLTPFDLASYNELVDVAGTSPTTADMRGTTVQGTQREWGALEYDSTLDIEAGSGTGTTIRNVVIPMFIRRR
jgi:hypothetical protein